MRCTARPQRSLKPLAGGEEGVKNPTRCLKCMRFAEIFASERKLGSRNTMGRQNLDRKCFLLPSEMLEIRRAKFECKLMNCSNVLNYFGLGL